MTRDYRLRIQIRNNLLLRRLEATRGFESIAQFCRKHGLRYGEIVNLVSMKDSPINGHTGSWRDIVERLASILRADPAELFPERQVRGEIQARSVEREVDEEMLIALDDKRAMAFIEDKTLDGGYAGRELIQKLVVDLPQRERDLIIGYFGLDGGGTGASLETLAAEYGIGRERANQMIKKAITRMRSSVYRKYHLMSGERYQELEANAYGGGAWTGRDGWGAESRK